MPVLALPVYIFLKIAMAVKNVKYQQFEERRFIKNINGVI